MGVVDVSKIGFAVHLFGFKTTVYVNFFIFILLNYLKLPQKTIGLKKSISKLDKFENIVSLMK